MVRSTEKTPDGALDIVMSASRVLVGLAARSLAESSDVTVHQFHALALIEAHAELTVNSLAHALDVSPSTVTRLCDRLVRKRLIERRHGIEDRREVGICVSPAGSNLVAEVTARRRATLSAIMANMTAAGRRELAAGLAAFVDASTDQTVHQLDVV